jgi:hypothetical protein
VLSSAIQVSSSGASALAHPSSGGLSYRSSVRSGGRLIAVTRKRLKRKKSTCKLCHPGKRAQSNRWTPKEEEALRRFEKALSLGTDWSDQ